MLAARIIVLTSLLAAPICGQSEEPDARTEKVGSFFRVIGHFDDASLAQQALDVVEATWPVAMQLYGVPPDAAPQPMEVHLYRDPDAYVRAEYELTRGQFRRNLAFAHWGTKTAHVAIQPRIPDDVLATLGLNYQTLRLLVHESAHLARYHAFKNYRAHPHWFADGNASWLEVEVLGSLGLMPAAEDDPSFSADIVRCQRLARLKSLPEVEAILADDTERLAFYDSYAVRWMLFRFLMTKHAAPLRKVLADLRRYGGSHSLAPRVLRSARRHLGQAMDDIDERFVAFVEAATPRWDEPIASLGIGRDAWVQTAFDHADAVAWRVEDDHTLPFRIRGSLRILRDGAEQLQVLLGRTKGGYVSVAFTAGYGVTVLRHSATGTEGRSLGSARLEKLVVGRDIPFVIEIAEESVTVTVEGEEVLQAPVDNPMNGPWGLGARAGSTGVWRGVEQVR